MNNLLREVAVIASLFLKVTKMQHLAVPENQKQLSLFSPSLYQSQV